MSRFFPSFSPRRTFEGKRTLTISCYPSASPFAHIHSILVIHLKDFPVLRLLMMKSRLTQRDNMFRMTILKSKWKHYIIRIRKWKLGGGEVGGGERIKDTHKSCRTVVEN